MHLRPQAVATQKSIKASKTLFSPYATDILPPAADPKQKKGRGIRNFTPAKGPRPKADLY